MSGLSFLILEIFVCLLIAAVIGGVVGWLLRGSSAGRRAEELERRHGDARAALEKELETVRRELEVCRERCSELEGAGEPAPARAAAAALPEKPPRRDDLKRIEGIGPKIEGLLNEAGIYTWEELSRTPAERIRTLLDNAGREKYRIHEPKTWPRQARLAHEEKWQELDQLQDELKGGREV